MNIIIIGNNSVLARTLKQELEHEYTVYMAGYRGTFDIYCDLAVNNSFDCKIEADLVINCASLFDNNSLEGYKNNITVNSIGNIEAIRLCKCTGTKRYIYISSLSAYDNDENVFQNDSYALSKKIGEEISAALCKQNRIAFTSLRITQLYDFMGCEEKHQPLLYHIFKQIEQDKQVTIFGNEDPLRNFMAVDDCVQIIKSVIEKNLQGIWPVIHKENYHLTEIICLIAEAFGKKVNIKFDYSKENIKSYYIPKEEGEKLYEMIKHSPQISFLEGMKRLKMRNG